MSRKTLLDILTDYLTIGTGISLMGMFIYMGITKSVRIHEPNSIIWLLELMLFLLIVIMGIRRLKQDCRR